MEPVVERVGCRLVAVESFGGMGNTIVRVSIDRPGGVPVSDCTRVSRLLSPVLDVEDPIPSAYTLEVSSPGFDRPIQVVEDFTWFVGCQARIKLYGMDGRKRVRGTLKGVSTVPAEQDDAPPTSSVLLETEDGQQIISLDDIERAHLVLDAAQFARMGQGLHPIASPDEPVAPKKPGAIKFSAIKPNPAKKGAGPVQNARKPRPPAAASKTAGPEAKDPQGDGDPSC